jgi:hypothetical protein
LSWCCIRSSYHFLDYMAFDLVLHTYTYIYDMGRVFGVSEGVAEKATRNIKSVQQFFLQVRFDDSVLHSPLLPSLPITTGCSECCVGKMRKGALGARSDGRLTSGRSVWQWNTIESALAAWKARLGDDPVSGIGAPRVTWCCIHQGLSMQLVRHTYSHAQQQESELRRPRDSVLHSQDEDLVTCMIVQ